MKKRTNAIWTEARAHVAAARRLEREALIEPDGSELVETYERASAARWALVVESLLRLTEDGYCDCGHVLDRSTDVRCRHCVRDSFSERTVRAVDAFLKAEGRS